MSQYLLYVEHSLSSVVVNATHGIFMQKRPFITNSDNWLEIARVSVCLATVLFFSSVLFGQVATLRGVISDETSAVVPGATVAVTGNAEAVRTVMTATDGKYSIAVPPGDYVVQASAP